MLIYLWLRTQKEITLLYALTEPTVQYTMAPSPLHLFNKYTEEM